MSALAGITIMELAEDVAGEYCSKLLANFGADVLKIERPGTGSPTRSMAAVVGAARNRENSGLFAYLNTNKKSVSLDVNTAADVDKLHALIAGADVVIDDHDEDWLTASGLTPEQAEHRDPDTIVCSITRFGYGAPKEWRSAKTLNVFHAVGGSVVLLSFASSWPNSNSGDRF
jgi:crotonobetainyl-CoA:carnitine CoA-transferase CaiB-like acyl-CoA transferase